MRSAGKGSSVEKVRAGEGGHRADLHEGRLAHDAARAPARDRPGRVGAQAVRRLGEIEREALGEEQEAIEEAARQLRRRRRSTSSQSWSPIEDSPAHPSTRLAASRRLRFSNLPSLPGGPMCSSTSWRERSSSLRISCASARCSGRSTPSTSTFRRGGARRAARSRRRRRPLASSQAFTASSRDAATDGVDTADRAARAGQEVVASRRARPIRSPGARPRGSRRSSRRRCGALPFAQALAQAPGAVRDHHQPGGAAAAEHVPDAAGEREQLASTRRAPRRESRRSGGWRARARRRRARASAGARRRRHGGARAPRRRRTGRARPASAARRRSCHSCSSPPCSSATSNGPTRSSAARRIVMLAPHA